MMAWPRMGHKIALDVALGLNYLHSRSERALGCSALGYAHAVSDGHTCGRLSSRGTAGPCGRTCAEQDAG